MEEVLCLGFRVLDFWCAIVFLDVKSSGLALLKFRMDRQILWLATTRKICSAFQVKGFRFIL